jgi:hypothetical protein
VSLSKLVEAIRSNQLEVGQRVGVNGFHGLVVLRAKVDSIALAGSVSEGTGVELPGEMSAAEFGRAIGLRHNGNVIALIEAGHSPAKIHFNSKTRQTQYRLSAEDISMFHRRFVTLTTLSLETGRHRNSLRRMIQLAGVAKFSPNGQDFGSVYLRADVAVSIV